MAGRMKFVPVPAYEPPRVLDQACVPCLEDQGLWYLAQQVRMGKTVYEYEVEETMEHVSAHERAEHPTMQAVPPIRSSSGTNSLGSMMSEGCPPNTGRRYDEV